MDCCPFYGSDGVVSQRIDKLRVAINVLAIAGCLSLAVVKGQWALEIWKGRGAATAMIQVMGMLLLLVAAVLILKRIRIGAFLGMVASIVFQIRIALPNGAHPSMIYIVLHVIVLWLNWAAWKSMSSAAGSI